MEQAVQKWLEATGNLPLPIAAARLGISPHTLRFWAIYRGLIPYVRLGRRILFRPADLAEFESRNRVEARGVAGR